MEVNRRCNVIGCQNRDNYGTRQSTKIFHSFPNNPVLRRKWLRRIGRIEDGKLWKPTGISRVCSDHFVPEDYRTGVQLKLRRSLLAGAVPSIFPEDNGERHIFTDSDDDDEDIGDDIGTILIDINDSHSAEQIGTTLKDTDHNAVEDPNSQRNSKMENRGQVLKIQRPFKDCEVMKLVKEYLYLYGTFQQLKELSRINVDLLYLWIDSTKIPDIKQEVDKVQELIHILTNGKEVYDIEISDVESIQHLDIESEKLADNVEDLNAQQTISDKDGDDNNEINQNTLMNLINNQGMLQPNTTNQLLGGLAAAIPQLQVQTNANNSPGTTDTTTATPTPDNVFDDLCGGGGVGKVSNHGNIREQALEMSSIDCDSIEEDDLNFLADTMGDSNTSNDSNINNTITPVIIPAPVPTPPKPTISPAPFPKSKPQPAPKSRVKASKSKQSKQNQPIVNVTVNNNLNRNSGNMINTSTNSQQITNNAVVASNINITNIQQGQKVNQQLITPTGQVYIVSADGQLVLKQQVSNTPLLTSNINSKPTTAQHNSSSPSTTTIPRPNINVSATGQAQQPRNNKSSSHADHVNNRTKSQMVATNVSQLKADNINISASSQKSFTLTTTSTTPVQQSGSHVFVKAGMASLKTSVVPVSSSQSLPQVSPSLSSQAHFVQVKNQQISTLAGKFIKQEPLAVIKQEPQDTKPAFSFFDPPLTASNSRNNNSTNVCVTTTSAISIQSSSLSSSINDIITTVSSSVIITSCLATTTSHSASIMSAATSTLTSQTNVSSGFSSTCMPSVRANADTSSSSFTVSSDAIVTSDNSSSQPSIPTPLSAQQTPVTSHGSGKNAEYENECASSPYSEVTKTSSIQTAANDGLQRMDHCHSNQTGMKNNDENKPDTCDKVLNKTIQSRSELEQYLQNFKLKPMTLFYSCGPQSELFNNGNKTADSSPAEGVDTCHKKLNETITNGLELDHYPKSLNASDPLVCPIGDQHCNIKASLKTYLAKKLENENKYLCAICGKKLKSQKSWQRHLSQHESKDTKKYQKRDQKKHQCNLCEQEFFCMQTLFKHMEVIHSSGPQCSICSMTFNCYTKFTEHLRLHREFGENEPNKCRRCGKKFSSLYSLRRHMKCHEEFDKNGPQKCTECGKEFMTKDRLEKHMICTHVTGRVTGIVSMCEICGKTFQTVSSMSSHKHKHLNHIPKQEECPICGKKFKVRALKRHMKSHSGEKLYKCSMCPKTFRYNFHRTIHESRVHNKSYPYTCSTCGKGYLKYCNLILHEQNHSSESGSHNDSHHNFYNLTKYTRYSCCLCKKYFVSNITYALHLLSTHSLEFNQENHCPLCKDGVAFSSVEFKSHLKTVHLNEKPFHCSVCRQSFYTVTRYVNHKILHKDENALHCKDCGKRFSCRSSLYNHRRFKHSPSPPALKIYVCHICGKQFKDKFKQVSHMVTHSGLKPYECSICGRAFGHKKSWRTHLWTHSKEKRFTCEKCEKSFHDKRYYKSHMNKFHPEHLTAQVG